MLVLTRKVGETIRIGDSVTVQVLDVRGGQVRLGLAAPADVRIFREELFRSLAEQRANGDDDVERDPALAADETAPRR
jgi:carbon storage regulator